MNKFNLRILLVGIVSIILGGVWLAYGIKGGDPDGVFTGGLWKGPLLLATGTAAIVVGLRMSRNP